MSQKIPIDFATISERIKNFSFPPTDMVIGIGRGGIVPASLVAHQLGVPLRIAAINYRDDRNNPQREFPEFLVGFELDVPKGFKLLIVDDVSVTGKTMDTIKSRLSDYEVRTFVLKGKGDGVLFPEISSCVVWPWKLEENPSLYAW